MKGKVSEGKEDGVRKDVSEKVERLCPFPLVLSVQSKVVGKQKHNFKMDNEATQVEIKRVDLKN